MNFSKIRDWFPDGSLHWLHRAYILDWLVVFSFWSAAIVISQFPPYERDFSPDDLSINFPHRKQQVSSTVNRLIALYIPLAIVTIVGAYKRSLIDIHHALLASIAGSGLSKLITDFLKNSVGRLRPDFLSRCRWETIKESCTGSTSSISDGRRSFPSGHSSTVFAGMVFLSLYLTSQLSIFAHSASSNPVLSSKLLRLVIIILPLFHASWVAITRIQDNKHHVDDAIVGGLIGTLCSTICFLIYWHNPFSSASSPRPVYTEDPSSRPNTDEYHIATVDDM